MSRVQIFSLAAENHSVSKGSQSVLTVQDNSSPQTVPVPSGRPGQVYLQHADTGEWAYAPEKVEGKTISTTSVEKLRSAWRVDYNVNDCATVHLMDQDTLMLGIDCTDPAVEAHVLLRTGATDERNLWSFE
ncbi:hypothetical protein BDY19DRAFT_905448 [Irpex rosettiformis]|uniref:Uncharacterized protein n=1 Tax=Irpex rosettiformis TaxID=378272 RepID=A0ACB8U8H3_9APHY|nr:hypothetical protein BDY19DRAFT_905448 [Irpex rosettiformis]